MNLSSTGVNVAGKIPFRIKALLKEAVENGYLSTSDFVRAAIKEKLERDGYLSSSGRNGEPVQP